MSASRRRTRESPWGFCPLTGHPARCGHRALPSWERSAASAAAGRVRRMEGTREELVDFLARGGGFGCVEFVEGVTGRGVAIDLKFGLLARGAERCGEAVGIRMTVVLIVR